MEDFETQLAETTDPFDRVKLIAKSAQQLIFADRNRAEELLNESLPRLGN